MTALFESFFQKRGVLFMSADWEVWGSYDEFCMLECRLLLHTKNVFFFHDKSTTFTMSEESYLMWHYVGILQSNSYIPLNEHKDSS